MLANLFNVDGVRGQTQIMRNAMAELQASEEAMTARQREIVDAVNACDWGCQDASVRHLVSVLFGIPIPARASKAQGPGIPFQEGGMISFQGQTLLVVRLDAEQVAFIMTHEGHIHTRQARRYVCQGEDWRPATDEEIDAFFGSAATPAPGEILDQALRRS